MERIKTENQLENISTMNLSIKKKYKYLTKKYLK